MVVCIRTGGTSVCAAWRVGCFLLEVGIIRIAMKRDRYADARESARLTELMSYLQNLNHSMATF